MRRAVNQRRRLTVLRHWSDSERADALPRRCGACRQRRYSGRVSNDPESKPVHLTLSPAVGVSGASAVISTPAVVQPSPARGTARAYPPLAHVGSAAVYPTTGASQVVVTPRADSVMPSVYAMVARDMWDMGTAGIGLAIGGTVGRVPGLAIGGAAGFVMGRVRWRYVHRKPGD
jgi:hypothetical protein